MTFDATEFQPLAAHVQGRGSAVMCLHSSTGSSAQWRALSNALRPRWCVTSPDLHGHGNSPAWPASAANTLRHEADAAWALAQPGSLDLVGHSFGAAVALQMALQRPERVRSLTLYEPVPFGMLGQSPADDSALDEIEGIAGAVASLVRDGKLNDAARLFVGYWSGGSAAWQRMTVLQQRAVEQRMPTVPRHFEALFGASWDATRLRALRMPVLLLRGSATRHSARRVGELLANALPQAQVCTLPGAGHLGPITHAALVAKWMLMHLDPVLAEQLQPAVALEAH